MLYLPARHSLERVWRRKLRHLRRRHRRVAGLLNLHFLSRGLLLRCWRTLLLHLPSRHIFDARRTIVHGLRCRHLRRLIRGHQQRELSRVPGWYLRRGGRHRLHVLSARHHDHRHAGRQRLSRGLHDLRGRVRRDRCKSRHNQRRGLHAMRRRHRCRGRFCELRGLRKWHALLRRLSLLPVRSWFRACHIRSLIL